MSGSTALLCLELLERLECDPQECVKVCVQVCVCLCVVMFVVSRCRSVTSR